MNLLLLIGVKEITQKNKKVLVRKRLLHNGYQISSITWDHFNQEDQYELITEYETIELVNDWLRRN